MNLATLELIRLFQLPGCIDVDIVKKLVAEGADITKDHVLYDLLVTAAMWGRVPLIDFIISLMDHMEDHIDIINIAFQYAARNGHIDAVKFLLNVPLVDVTASDNEAIKCAVMGNNLEIVKLLLTLKDVNVCANNNYAIIHAIEQGYQSMVEFLIVGGWVKVHQSQRLLMLAASEKQFEIVNIIITLPDFDVKQYYSHNMQDVLKLSCGEGEEVEGLSTVAILLYYVPNIEIKIGVWQYKYAHRKILSNLRSIIHKVAISLTELPTPLIIEIVDQSVDFAIYVPYHYKWDMVVKIKHGLAAPYGSGSAQ